MSSDEAKKSEEVIIETLEITSEPVEESTEIKNEKKESVSTMDATLKAKLQSLGLTEEQVVKLEAEGVQVANDMAMLDAGEVQKITGCKLIPAKKIEAAFAPVVTPPPSPILSPAAEEDANAEIPEGKQPTSAQVSSFATQMGMDPSMLMMLLMGQLGSGVGMEGMNFSGMMPIPQIVAGYNPKRRDISYMIMGQLERSLGVPIVVINSDGSVNHALTAEYAMNLDEGFESMKDGVFNDAEGNPYEIVKVGVDAQSIYDADPLDSSRPLQKNGMGIGRINWNKVPTEVRQVVYFAVKQTNEINPSDQSNLQWLRDNIKPTATRMTLRGLCPSANNAYNEAFRTGSLPTLRVQLSRSPRRPSTMPNRRSKTPRDLSDYGKEDMSSVEDGFRG